LRETRFLRFLAVGGFSTLCQYATLAALVEIGGYDATPASAIGYAAGAVVNYLLNRRWTFRSDMRHRESLVRFICMVAVGSLCNVALMHVLAGGAGINYMAAQVLVTAVILLLNFFLSASWVFNKQA
jgi:putative flippase GtrA